MQIPEPDIDEDFFEALSAGDENAIRSLLVKELADIVADAAILNAPPEQRLSYGHLADIVETINRDSDIEEVVFTLLTFGFDTEISIDPNMPEGHPDRVDIIVVPTGKGIAPGLRA